MLICFEYLRAHLKWGPKIFSELTIVATVVNQIEHKNCTVVKGFLDIFSRQHEDLKETA